MAGFIDLAAQQLYRRYGDRLPEVQLLFPSRRAGLFFAEALASLSDKPMWLPGQLSIDDLMSRISGLRVADNTRLLAELYKVWSLGSDESFDSFYYWGGMLLTDFDQVDKYLVDARMLFSNMHDLKALDGDHEYLSPDQHKLVQRFWDSFSLREGFSQEQGNFLGMWERLLPVYLQYREALAAQGMAYTGMMHRAATERMDTEGLPEQVRGGRYAVIGFNALTKCERRLFDALKESAEVDFFWDYDDYYTRETSHEAGHFMRENLRRYPQTEPTPGGNYNFTRSKNITVVSAPSDTLQCKYVNTFLEEVAAADPAAMGKQTAVVLVNEGLLETVLYSMPEGVDEINVTMGYPLRQTLAYSFLERLLELQKHRKTDDGLRFYHSDAEGLLLHPFVVRGGSTAQMVEKITEQRMIYPRASWLACNDLLAAVFRSPEGWQQMGDYLLDVLSRVAAGEADGMQREFLSATADSVRKLCNSIKDCGLEVSERVFASLLRRQLQAVRIPYQGEPLQGVQVMGFLETRALDFENVVVLSVNDDLLPGNHTIGTSLIPYSLRVGYGLPTAADHEAMYAYYFYRLLQRAGRVDLIYCSRSDDRRKGEPSRYIYQLDYESPHAIMKREIALDANMAAQQELTVSKEGSTLDLLNKFLYKDGGRRLSPTALSAYVVCPMRFYFRAVAGLTVREQVSEDVDARLFGNILHRAMEILYTDIDPAQIGALKGSDKVVEAVEQAIRNEYLKSGEQIQQAQGNIHIAKDVVCRLINENILTYDASQPAFRIESLEAPLECPVEFEVGGEKRTAQFYGKADRIDMLPDGLRRVVDYKTARSGGASLNMEFDGVESLFAGEARAATSAALQTMLYGLMLRTMRGGDVRPSVYAVRHLSDPAYSEMLTDRSCGLYVSRYSDYAVEFQQRLKELLAEIFDPSQPFTQCGDIVQCTYCDFKELCGR